MEVSKTRYYMNSPCEIIREISEDFSEVKVYPKFADSFEGSQWCTECMAGSGYSSHTCEPYQDVIDAINDTQAAMIIVVENRLLHDKPVEFAKWEKAREILKKAENDTKEQREISDGIKKEIFRVNQHLSWLKSCTQDASETLANKNDKISKLENEISQLRRSLSGIKDAVSINGITLSMSAGSLRELMLTSVKMEALEAGGVDNWEWYGESLTGVDIEAEADKRLSSISIKSIA